jgi:hypothetical protein
MAAEKKTKTCKGPCHKTKPVGEFPDSAFAKDGKLGFCSICWSKKMTKSAAGRSGPTKTKAKKTKARIGRPPGSKSKPKVSIADANAALQAASATKEKFLVRANDGDMAEFDAEDKALRQAMEWQMAGYSVTVWRQCEFEMVLRIIG